MPDVGKPAGLRELPTRRNRKKARRLAAARRRIAHARTFNEQLTETRRALLSALKVNPSTAALDEYVAFTLRLCERLYGIGGHDE